LDTLLIPPMCVTCPAHHILLGLISLIMSAEESYCKAPHYAVFSSLYCFLPHSPKYSPQYWVKHPQCTTLLLKIQFFLQISLMFGGYVIVPCIFSFNVRDKILHPYKTKGKVIAFQIMFILMFLHSRRELVFLFPQLTYISITPAKVKLF
jgi:hypothetical protein